MKFIRKLLVVLAKKFRFIRYFFNQYSEFRKFVFRNITSRFIKIDSRLIVFESFTGRNYSDSPKAIYEYMLNSPEFKGYHFIWAFKYPTKYSYLKSDRTEIVKFRSRKHLAAYAKAKYWISNSRLGRGVDKNPNQTYIQTWHGTPFKRLAHDILKDNKHAVYDQSELAEMYDREAQSLDYMLSPSAACSEILTSCFDLVGNGKADAIIEEGYPRNDFLINHTTKDVDRIKQELDIPGDKKVLLYAPTWRDSQHTSGVGYTLDLPVDFDYLKKQLSNEWVILFRTHAFVANEFDFDKYKGFVYDVSKHDDVNELYIASDALMTDYSSVFYDFANLKRPIIFYMYDLEHYKDELRGFYQDIDTLPGQVVRQEKEIVNILGDLKNYSWKFAEKYNAFNNVYTYMDDGHATERVLNRLKEKGEFDGIQRN